MKIAFISPWYEEHISGGAEAALRGLAHNLVERGIDVEILTTRVKEFSSDWGTNFYKKGYSEEYGLKIRRFDTDRRNRLLFNALNQKILDGEVLSQKEEQLFMGNMINSEELYNYISEHKEDYDLFVFMIYMFGTTLKGASVCPEKSVVIPCFHDEGYIYLEIYKEVFGKVKGMIFLSEPEKSLAERVFDLSHVSSIVTGTGVDTRITGDGERFLKQYDIKDPFILYAGRKDAGKNVYLLLKYFRRYKETHRDIRLKLILIGGGKIWLPEDLKDEVIDLGFVEKQTKYDAMAAAELLCQPSLHESFSIVIMESWLCRRPVLVHSYCTVTSDFAKKSGGGYWFSDYEEFEKYITECLDNKAEASEKGNKGYDYVARNFSWETVTGKTVEYFCKLAGTCKDSRIAEPVDINIEVTCEDIRPKSEFFDSVNSVDVIRDEDSVNAMQGNDSLDVMQDNDSFDVFHARLSEVEKENMDYYTGCRNKRFMVDIKKAVKGIIYKLMIKMAVR